VLVAASLVGFLALRASVPKSAPDRTTAIDAELAAAGRLPQSPAPAFRPGKPRLLDRSEKVYRWAPVLRTAEARAAPSAAAPVVATLDTRTPEGTTNLVLVVGARQVAGRLWVRVRLAVLPNNTTGWVPRSALGGYHFVHTRLVVNLARLQATLLYDGRVIFRAPVGVGQSRSPTPTGSFYVREELTRFASPFYGPIAFGTSARSSVLTDWPSGGFVGIHGTNEPGLIPGRVSHGCIRLRNRDIIRLSRLMPVGTPVTVR
jgi:lipoprotein-anchoring transpeptidase ErfK/SrfK